MYDFSCIRMHRGNKRRRRIRFSAIWREHVRRFQCFWRNDPIILYPLVIIHFPEHLMELKVVKQIRYHFASEVGKLLVIFSRLSYLALVCGIETRRISGLPNLLLTCSYENADQSSLFHPKHAKLVLKLQIEVFAVRDVYIRQIQQ